jgi:hypothetical protein
VLNAATYDEAIATSDLERLIACLDAQMPGHDIGHLIVRVAVRRPSPSFFHAVLREKQLGVIGTDAPLQSRFRRCGLNSSAGYIHYLRK